MRLSTFLRFVGPSAGLMLLLLALPLVVTFYLSVRNCTLQMETVTVTESSPFGTKEWVTTMSTGRFSSSSIRLSVFAG